MRALMDAMTMQRCIDEMLVEILKTINFAIFKVDIKKYVIQNSFHPLTSSHKYFSNSNPLALPYKTKSYVTYLKASN